MGLATSATTVAQETGIVSKWEFTVAGVFTSVDTDIRADASEVDLGTRIDLEDALGFDDREILLRLTAGRRLWRRHFVNVDMQNLSRSAARDIPFEIRFQDVVFPAHTRVISDFSMRLIDLRYSYLPVLREKTAVSVTAGVGRWDYDVDVSATGQMTGATLSSALDVREIVPLVGGRVRQQVSRRLRFDARLMALSFDLGSTSGAIVDADLGFSYWFHRNVGLALSFYHLNADIDLETSRGPTANVEYDMTGIQVYIPIRFD